MVTARATANGGDACGGHGFRIQCAVIPQHPWGDQMRQSRPFRYVLAVSRHGWVRKAAEVLNIAPAAVNRQILEFERDLRMPLFDRLPHGVKLTSAGEVAEGILAHVPLADPAVPGQTLK